MIFSQPPDSGGFLCCNTLSILHNCTMKKLLIILLLILINYSCSGRYTSDRNWEGIKETRMRIIISDFFKDEDNTKIKKGIKRMAGERAMLILASHATLNLDESGKSNISDRLLNDAISRSLKTGRILYIDCTDSNYCRSMSEFDITPYTVTLDNLNSIK